MSKIFGGAAMGQQLCRTPGDDLMGYLTRYPQELTFGPEDPVAVFGRYHTDDFVLRNDGIPLDKQRLLAHVKVGRRNATQINVNWRLYLDVATWAAFIGTILDVLAGHPPIFAISFALVYGIVTGVNAHRSYARHRRTHGGRGRSTWNM
jgi:hypothetical protein